MKKQAEFDLHKQILKFLLENGGKEKLEEAKKLLVEQQNRPDDK